MVKHTIELMKASDKSVIIRGQGLRVEWLDSFILVYSDKDHPYKGVTVKKKEVRS